MPYRIRPGSKPRQPVRLFSYLFRNFIFRRRFCSPTEKEKGSIMEMNYEQARAYLAGIEAKGNLLGLESVRVLLAELGDPQDRLKFVHIAGTNGKGSAMAFLEQTLQEAGYRAGRYISPSVFAYEEKIRVNGQWIPKEKVAEYVSVIAEAIGRLERASKPLPTIFEVETALSFLYFTDQKCDLVLLEVGMGGAEDATNVVKTTVLEMFASISLDHMEFLGDTLEKIAATKAGIIKPGCSAVCYDGAPEVTEVIRGVCEKLGVPLRCNDFSRLTPLSETLDGQEIAWDGRPYRLALLGRHQLHNTATVMETVDSLRERGWEIPDEAVRTGLASVKWPARLEVLGRDPLFLLDGGHNPQCA